MSGAIWLASYPKSGNTWARLALWSLRQGGGSVDLTGIARFGEVVTHRALFETELSIDAGMLSLAELERLRPAMHDALFRAAYEPLLCKVHDRWFRTTDDRPVFDPVHTHAAIYLVRDPRDIVISWARFQGRSIDWAIAFLASPHVKLAATTRGNDGHVCQPLGTWSQHVTSWVDDSGLIPLVVRYEDMHADLGAVLRAMKRRIGWESEETAISGAVAATRFARLVAQEKRAGFAETPDSAQRFFRSGRVGEWRETLSADQIDRIEGDHHDVMRRFGYC